MPRRTPEEARKAAILEGIAKLRFTLRNKEFRKDLAEIRQHESEPCAKTHSVEDQQAYAKAIEEASTYPAPKPDDLGALTVSLPRLDVRPVKK